MSPTVQTGRKISLWLDGFNDGVVKNLDEAFEKSVFVSTKVHLVVTKDENIFKTDQLIVSAAGSQLLKNDIAEAIALGLSKEKIGIVFRKCLRIDLDLFLKDANNTYTWVDLHYRVESSVAFQQSRTKPLSMNALVEHYQVCQKAFKQESIPIFNQKKEFYEKGQEPLQEINSESNSGSYCTIS